ncbi:MAG: cytochrome c3 family protein [bacterium]|nr:MAG: cytochrome c3 family protein [bacterium]
MKIKQSYFFMALILVTIFVASKQEPKQNPHGNLKLDCKICHTTSGWTVNSKSIAFKHKTTGYPLVGQHRNVACRNCHKNLIFSFVGIACADCHTDFHRGQFGNRCDNCHTPVNWENRSEVFEQHNRSAFPLIGVHAVADCEACHFNQHQNEYANTPIDCKACHLENFTTSTNPDHKKANLGTNCQECHIITIDWQNTNFQHPASFVLRGEHSKLDCNSCHVSTYSGTANICYGCHENTYKNTTNPNHLVFGFRTDCTICHDETSWEGANFNHLNESGFDLVGAHQQLQCIACHVGNQVSNLPRDCFGCHQSDYNKVSNPNHAQNNYDHDCTKCHSTTGWIPADLVHDQAKFPLTGAHANVPCADCHVNGYAGTPTDCFSCHSGDYNSVSNPNHVQNNFNHDCVTCHTTSAWLPATFDHSQSKFPLTGAHSSVACADCHANGYSGTPTNCMSCHEQDYNNTTNPNHNAAQFPTECESCHNTSNWTQTTWDHDNQYFPIDSGRHRGAWNACSDCHVNPNDYKNFECINCHAHRKDSTDQDHRGVNRYVYESAACYNCHPRGN